MKFQGSQDYVATPDLMLAVNAAITLTRPLLVKGEPGTGKTLLAEEVAKALGLPLLQWHVKSTTKAQQGLYEYDAVSRLTASYSYRPCWALVVLFTCHCSSGRPSALATSSASSVLPVPGSPLTSSGRVSVMAALTASIRSGVAT